MTPVQGPEKILKELAGLWVSLGKQGSAEIGGVLRACSMTLVVIADMADDAGALGETVAALMPEHPARAIIVRLQGAGERTMAARVYSQCWMPFGQRRQICCEQIEIAAPDAALADLPALLVPLTTADLPLIVWCRSGRLPLMAEFDPIAKMARKVILDSRALEPAPGGPSALDHLQGAVQRGLIISDLAWTRLTRWREMLAQVFENSRYLELLAGIDRVQVTFRDGQETSAAYMAAWLTGALESAGAHAGLILAPGNHFAVELEGRELRVQQSCSDGTLTVKVNDLSQCTSLPRATDYLLVREELGILRRDPVYAATLARAATLVRPELK